MLRHKALGLGSGGHALVHQPSGSVQVVGKHHTLPIVFMCTCARVREREGVCMYVSPPCDDVKHVAKFGVGFVASLCLQPMHKQCLVYALVLYCIHNEQCLTIGVAILRIWIRPSTVHP